MLTKLTSWWGRWWASLVCRSDASPFKTRKQGKVLRIVRPRIRKTRPDDITNAAGVWLKPNTSSRWRRRLVMKDQRRPQTLERLMNLSNNRGLTEYHSFLRRSSRARIWNTLFSTLRTTCRLKLGRSVIRSIRYRRHPQNRLSHLRMLLALKWLPSASKKSTEWCLTRRRSSVSASRN